MATFSGAASAVTTTAADPMEDGQSITPDMVLATVDKKREDPAPVAGGKPTEMTRWVVRGVYSTVQ